MENSKPPDPSGSGAWLGRRPAAAADNGPLYRIPAKALFGSLGPPGAGFVLCYPPARWLLIAMSSEEQKVIKNSLKNLSHSLTSTLRTLLG